MNNNGNDGPVSRKTMAYSFINPDRVVNVGASTVEPTVPMNAVEEEAFQNLTVGKIVSRLIERNVTAWKALPLNVRGAMIDRAKDFQFVPIKSGEMFKVEDLGFDILYNGIVFHWRPDVGAWVIQDIVR